MEYEAINNLTKEQLQEMLNSGLTKKAILENLGVPVKTSSRDCLNRLITKYEITFTSGQTQKIGNVVHYQPYTKEYLEELCASSVSLAEVLRKAGRKGGGAQETLKKKIEKFGIDISHFTGQTWNKGLTKYEHPSLMTRIEDEFYQPNEIFTKNPNITRKVVRQYLLRHPEFLPYQCCQCGCDGSWQGGFIALELHHKDGDSTNNELDNLEWRCPNCHALTENYRGKNKGR